MFRCNWHINWKTWKPWEPLNLRFPVGRERSHIHRLHSKYTIVFTNQLIEFIILIGDDLRTGCNLCDVSHIVILIAPALGSIWHRRKKTVSIGQMTKGSSQTIGNRYVVWISVPGGSSLWNFVLFSTRLHSNKDTKKAWKLFSWTFRLFYRGHISSQ